MLRSQVMSSQVEVKIMFYFFQWLKLVFFSRGRPKIALVYKISNLALSIKCDLSQKYLVLSSGGRGIQNRTSF